MIACPIITKMNNKETKKNSTSKYQNDMGKYMDYKIRTTDVKSIRTGSTLTGHNFVPNIDAALSAKKSAISGLLLHTAPADVEASGLDYCCLLRRL